MDRPIMAYKFALIVYIMEKQEWSINTFWHKICKDTMEQYN